MEVIRERIEELFDGERALEIINHEGLNDFLEWHNVQVLLIFVMMKKMKRPIYI